MYFGSSVVGAFYGIRVMNEALIAGDIRSNLFYDVALFMLPQRFTS